MCSRWGRIRGSCTWLWLFLFPVNSYVLPTTAATVATGVNLDVSGMVYPQFSSSAVEGFASQVVGSLPLGEVFAAPVFFQVHQEQLAGGEIPENFEIPVVQKQVIVQTSPHVVDSLLPVAEFTSPMYNPVHQEQFSAGDTTENFADFLVGQEQVLVQAIPRLVGSSPPVDEFTAYVARRPSPLVEVQPSVRAQRHIVEDLGELAPLVQILDLPVPQTVASVTDILAVTRPTDCRAGYRSADSFLLFVSVAFLCSRTAVSGSVGGSADRPDSHAHSFADRGAERRHSSFSWSCSWFPPRTEFCYASSGIHRVGGGSATPTAGPGSGTVALRRSFGRLRLASRLSGSE